jgi:uncharacterized protein
MARALSAPGKTRLAPDISDARLRTLRRALVADTLHLVSSVGGVDRFICFTPAEAQAEMASLAAGGFALLPQRGDDLGQRMRFAFEDLLIGRGYVSAILVGSDLPLLTTAHFTAAIASLQANADVVIGPADDGGYYLIGLRAANAALFDGIRWSTPHVLADTMRAARRSGLEPKLIQAAYDIDTMEDLQRLERDLAALPPDAAMNIRGWLDSR